MSKARKHIHKYHQLTLSYGKIWACADMECTHHMPQHLTETLNGKQSLCWECNERFQLTPMNMQETRPKCDNCKLEKIEEVPLSEDLKKKLTDLGIIN